MLGDSAAGRVRKQRRPPQLRLQAGGVDRIGQAAHTVRAYAVVRLPVAFADLEAVVHIHPLEPELHHLRERADHFVHGELAFVAPGAPDGIIGLVRRNRRLNPVHRLHILRELADRAEEIARALDYEVSVARQDLSRPEHHRLFVILANHGLSHVPLAGHRYAHDPQAGLHEPDGQAAVCVPHGHERRAPAIVRGRHAEEIILVIPRPDRLNPVAAVFVGHRLQRPDLPALEQNPAGLHRADGDRLRAHVLEAHGPDRHPGESLGGLGRDRDLYVLKGFAVRAEQPVLSGNPAAGSQQHGCQKR